ncbi:MAG: hypothetical protein O7G30_01245, partial [Proteobacteria bacterium]|nr:hypothetical protein [Pseudomonadota bacterium]
IRAPMAARFDVVPDPDGSGQRLQLAWRSHVLDGYPLPDVRHSSQVQTALDDPMALPTALAERYGRLFVGSNTGAVVCIDAADGRVHWVETYPQEPLTTRAGVKPASPHTWKDVPVIVDGPYVHVAPRDSEHLLRFAVAPLLPSRSLLVDQVPVRGLGTAIQAGTPLGSLQADDLVTVRDGIAYISGSVPPREQASLLPASTPLVGYRLRAPRPGESMARLVLAQIPEYAASGHPVLVQSGILFPSHKGIYRAPLPALGGPATRLWESPRPSRFGRSADRAGNLVPQGRFLWSVTPSRIVLFHER